MLTHAAAAPKCPCALTAMHSPPSPGGPGMRQAGPASSIQHHQLYKARGNCGLFSSGSALRFSRAEVCKLICHLRASGPQQNPPKMLC